MRKLFLGLFICLFAGCTYIEPGYVGIKVNSYGSQKGIEDFPVQVGRVWYNPWTEDIYTYPTFMQTKVWTDDLNEDNPIDESIGFNSSEGAVITANVGINYNLDPTKVPKLFIEFRQPIDVVTSTYLRNKVRDHFNIQSSKMKAVDIFGQQKSELLILVKKSLDEELRPKGFIIDTLSFGRLKADERVMNSINLVIEATQKAQEAENKVKQVEAEARQAAAKASGEAEAILKLAEADAKANDLIAKSITPELVRYKMFEKWDGIAPKVVGGESSLLLNMEDLQTRKVTQ